MKTILIIRLTPPVSCGDNHGGLAKSAESQKGVRCLLQRPPWIARFDEKIGVTCADLILSVRLELVNPASCTVFKFFSVQEVDGCSLALSFSGVFAFFSLDALFLPAMGSRRRARIS